GAARPSIRQSLESRARPHRAPDRRSQRRSPIMTSLELFWKATAILLAAFAATALMRRSTAALRHFLWTAAFAALLVLPVARQAGPRWEAPLAVPVIAVTMDGPGPAAPVRQLPAVSLSTLWWIG